MGTELSAPTSDLARAEQDLRDTGVCLFSGALDASQLARVREALYRAADDEARRGRAVKFGFDYAHDDTNQRVWNLISRDPIFGDLAEHPAALALLRAFLGGRSCSRTSRRTSPAGAAAGWCCTPTRSTCPSRGRACRA
jgi:hypothetical protein